MNKRILVVDDDEDTRVLFDAILHDVNCEIDSAASGFDALELLRQYSYGLIFLDLKMPRMDGTETLREIRKIDQNVSVYLMTAFHPDFFSKLKTLNQDQIDFDLLKKPLDISQIVSIVDGALT